MPLEIGIGQAVLLLMTVGLMAGLPAAVLAVAYRLGRRSAPGTPEAVLRSRFARGEITQAEFDAAVSALGR